MNISRCENVVTKREFAIISLEAAEHLKPDTSDIKLNLGVGPYRTEELHPYVLDVVKKAKKPMLERGENKEYLPIEGLAAFNKATAELLLGVENPAINKQRVCIRFKKYKCLEGCKIFTFSVSALLLSPPFHDGR